MNKLIAILALGVCFGNVSAKSPKKDKASEEGFVFTTVKENPITSVKDQNRSSTCWAFSTLLGVLYPWLLGSRIASCRKRGIRPV